MNELLNSPLSEADPLSVQEVMDMDVLQLAKTPEARAVVVRELRAARARWSQAEAKTRAKPKVAATPANIADILSSIKL